AVGVEDEVEPGCHSGSVWEMKDEGPWVGSCVREPTDWDPCEEPTDLDPWVWGGDAWVLCCVPVYLTFRLRPTGARGFLSHLTMKSWSSRTAWLSSMCSARAATSSLRCRFWRMILEKTKRSLLISSGDKPLRRSPTRLRPTISFRSMAMRNGGMSVVTTEAPENMQRR